ncbi:RTCB protein [Prevotella pectinovora]|jgi:tRNA-splicing ligase RtcB|uniref:3'-phosphate/5'-hydroxy nucleic acid ligase n=1 Tax=Prevotella pectinovora TaxID=1602169 RepID=A0A0D0I704_9BACT|nr:RtcB family protein [Prevotella pectinovora]KIP63229.1 RTCB protein [Prevotella pectinovora]
MEVKIINDRPVKIWTDNVEESAMRQIENLTTLPFLFHHLAIMPDVHAGMGMPIGGVLACNDAVIPNAVGVDIGCGMCAVKTSWKLENITPEVLRKKIMRGIRKRIPLGMDHHKEPQDEAYLPTGHDIDKTVIVKQRHISITKEVGTLGGGNHFIELQKDEEGTLWIMIHSGSRNLGARVGEHYNKIARDLNEKWHSVVKPELRLSFLPRGTKEFEMYWNEMRFCIDFAFCNRRLMMQRIEEVIADALPGIEFEPMINIAHNYAAFEHHYGEDVIVHRKGATLAREGIVGIIPGSQGTASYIVEGLGNPESFCSCSHGAGRVMSRTAAIKTLDMAAEVAQLEAKGIVHAIRCQDDMQEASGAYKDIETVIKNELDLVKIKTRLLPIAVIKG